MNSPAPLRRRLVHGAFALGAGMFLGFVGTVPAQSIYTWGGAATGSWSTTGNWTPAGNPGSAGSGTTDIANLVNLGASAAVNITYDAGASGYLGTLNLYNTTATNSTTLTLNRDLTIDQALTMYQTSAGTANLALNGHNLTIAQGAVMTLGGTTVTNPTQHADITTTAAGSTIFVNGELLLSQSATSTQNPVAPGIGYNVGTNQLLVGITLGDTGLLDLDTQASGSGVRLIVTGNFTTTGTNTIESTAAGTGTLTSNTLFLSGVTNTIGSGTTFTGFTGTGTGSNMTLEASVATGGVYTQTTSTAALLPAFIARDANLGTSATPVATKEIFSSTATANSGAISNAVNTIALYNSANSSSGGYAAFTFTLGSDLNLASGTTPFTFAWGSTTTNSAGDSTTIDLNGHAYNATAATSTVGFNPGAVTTAGVMKIGIANSGASSISGGQGIFKAYNFTLSTSDTGIGAGVILQATGASTEDLGVMTSGVTMIDPTSTFYYNGGGTTQLKSNRAIGNIVVGDGTTASKIFLNGTTNVPLVSAGTATVNANSTLDIHGSTGYLTTTGLLGAGTVDNETGSSQSSILTINVTGSNTFTGKVTDSGATGALNVAIGSGFTGTQVFSGTNSYHGTTTVSGGTLLLTGGYSGGGAITVNGGRLGGAGGTITSSGVTVSSGGLSVSGAGAVTPGTMTLALGSGSLSLSGVAGTNANELVFSLGSTGASDKVFLSSATSTLAIGSGLLSLSDFSFATTAGFGAGTYVLFDTAASGAISGSLASSGLSGTLGGENVTLSLSTDGGGNADIVLTVAAPEPGSLALAGIGVMLLGLALRRRRCLG